MPRLFESTAIALAASGVETEELTEQVESSVAALQREHDVLKEHVLLRNTELPKGANMPLLCASWQVSSLRTVLACCTPRSRTRRLSAATSELQPTAHGYNLAAIGVLQLQPGLGVFLDTIYDAFKMRRGGAYREDPTVLRKGGAVPITQR
jgi:hypothetical protein